MTEMDKRYVRKQYEFIALSGIEDLVGAGLPFVSETVTGAFLSPAMTVFGFLSD